MISALLILSLGVLLPFSVLLFTPAARWCVGVGSSVAVLLSALSSAAAAMRLCGGGAFDVAAAAVVLALATLGWTRVTPRWGVVGRLVWATSVVAGGAYLVAVMQWTLTGGLGPFGAVTSLVLWLLETAAYLVGLAYLWELVDVLASATLSRRATPGAQGNGAGMRVAPFVSLHVPAHNEPPDMVIATLRSLLQLDYPAYEVLMVDDNTTDPALWEPVRDFCAQHPEVLRFHHLEDWPGFKSGALNYALQVTDPQAEIIGVVDADYLVQPHYLRECVPLFVADERVGFVQSPQDYRDWRQSAYYRRLYYSYAYFFAVSQISRNERDAAIFGGTMGLIRRSALEQVGRWDEWCITEDAELSLRLLRAGWSGRHVEQSFGTGVMPLTFDALKRQRFRWCFGGIQILRMHGRSLLPWDRSPDNKLSLAQRWAYLSGGLQWYGDLLGLLFAGMLLVGAADLALGGGLVFRRLSGVLLAAVPMLGVLGLFRAVATLRRTSDATWRDATGAFGLWLALGWTVARASLRGLVEPAGVFLRTPKTRGHASWVDALRVNAPEAVMGLLGVGAIGATLLLGSGAARWLLTALLVVPVAGQLAAPLNSLAALRADLPDDLRRRRRIERRLAWAAGPLRPRRLAGVGAALGASAMAGVFVLAPAVAPGSATGPRLFGNQAAPGTPPKVATPGGANLPRDEGSGAGAGSHRDSVAAQPRGVRPAPAASPSATRGAGSTAAPSPRPGSQTAVPSQAATPTARPTPSSRPTATPSASTRPTPGGPATPPTPTRRPTRAAATVP